MLERLPALRFLCLDPFTMSELLTVRSGAFLRLSVCRLRGTTRLCSRRELGRVSGGWSFSSACRRRLEFQLRVQDHPNLYEAGFEFWLENLDYLEETTICIAVHDAS